jgi:hypothetical protein
MFASKSQFVIAELNENGRTEIKTVLTLRRTSTTRYTRLHAFSQTDCGMKKSSIELFSDQ